ncbi:MAG: hypothetical protein QNJ29_15200 [Rhizobiaceae bacterium]|nr:hypothetical protein [Rhizobiaceae bacterium]
MGQTAAAIGSLALLAACQNAGAPSASLSINSKQKPVQAVASIARTAQKCWFKSGDKNFSGIRMSNEVNSFSGRPRFLLVKRSDPNGLPLLVVQAEQKGDATSGSFTNIQTFGPLLQTSNGKRITDDVKRWSRGSGECKA